MFHLLWPNPSGSLCHLNSFPPGLFCTGPIRDVYLIHWGCCMISDFSELCLVFTFLRSVLCCSVTLSICKNFGVCLSIMPLGNSNQTDRVQTKLLSTFLWPLAFFFFFFFESLPIVWSSSGRMQLDQMTHSETHKSSTAMFDRRVVTLGQELFLVFPSVLLRLIFFSFLLHQSIKCSCTFPPVIFF